MQTTRKLSAHLLKVALQLDCHQAGLQLQCKSSWLLMVQPQLWQGLAGSASYWCCAKRSQRHRRCPAGTGQWHAHQKTCLHCQAADAATAGEVHLGSCVLWLDYTAPDPVDSTACRLADWKECDRNTLHAADCTASVQAGLQTDCTEWHHLARTAGCAVQALQKRADARMPHWPSCVGCSC